MEKWVVGFLFCKDQVLLIRKKRPSWHMGQLNGMGGKIEEGESPREAMKRECKEECGLEVDWHHYVTIRAGNHGWSLWVFRAFTHQKYLSQMKQLTDEELILIPVGAVLGIDDLVDKLSWLIPLALDHRTLDNKEVISTL